MLDVDLEGISGCIRKYRTYSGCESDRIFIARKALDMVSFGQRFGVVENPVLLLFYYFWRPRFAALTRNLNWRDCPLGSSLVSVEQAFDEIPATGGRRMLARYCRVMNFILGGAGQN